MLVSSLFSCQLCYLHGLVPSPLALHRPTFLRLRLVDLCHDPSDHLCFYRFYLATASWRSQKKCGNLWCIQMVASLTVPLKKWNCAVESRVSWDWRLMKIESVHCFMKSYCFMISSDSWQSSRFFPTWSNAKRFASNLLFNATWGFLKSLYISETYHNPDIHKNP